MKIRRLLLSTLKESPENKLLYNPITEDQPATVKLAEAIKHEGVLVPFVVTADRYIESGHRRFVAAKMAGVKSVPCEVTKFRRGDSEEINEELLQGSGSIIVNATTHAKKCCAKSLWTTLMKNKRLSN